MTIGEKIIAATLKLDLLVARDTWGGLALGFVPAAAGMLDALVAAHVEEQVRLRLEARDKLFNRAIELIMNEWGKTREEALDWLSRDEEWITD